MRRLDAYKTYIGLSGVSSFLFTLMFTVSGIYRIEVAGLNPLQIVLVGTVLELFCFVFEVPTGIVADNYSRRLSVIIGYFLVGVGFFVEGALPIFATILLAQGIWGVGATFVDGAELAWITDELNQRSMAKVYLRASQSAHLGSMAGIILSITLASFSLRLPLMLSGGLFVLLAILLYFIMPETNFQPTPPGESSSWQMMGATIRRAFGVLRGNRVVSLLIGVSLFYGLSSEGFDRLWELHFLQNYQFPQMGDLPPIVWFGIINIGAIFLSMAAAEIARRLIDQDNPLLISGLLVGINLATVGCIVLFGLAGKFWIALAFYWASSILRRTNGPFYDAWLNQGLESKTRATVLSVSTLINSLGQIVGGPVVGLAALHWTVGTGLALSGTIMLPVVLLLTAASLSIKNRTSAPPT